MRGLEASYGAFMAKASTCIAASNIAVPDCRLALGLGLFLSFQCGCHRKVLSRVVVAQIRGSDDGLGPTDGSNMLAASNTANVLHYGTACFFELPAAHSTSRQRET